MSRERQTMLHINYTSNQYAVNTHSLPGHKTYPTASHIPRHSRTVFATLISCGLTRSHDGQLPKIATFFKFNTTNI